MYKITTVILLILLLIVSAALYFKSSISLPVSNSQIPTPTEIISTTQIPTPTEIVSSPTAIIIPTTATLSSQTLIKSALIKKDNLSADAIINITKENADYAKGNISFPNENGGGMFLAAKVNGVWTIVYSGNGSVDCISLKKNYSFPADFISNFCD